MEKNKIKQVDNKYKCIPFWSWNDELDEKELVKQIEWMKDNGVGGFFMHARGGLKTEYLGEKWFSCVRACGEKAKELGMHAYAYDENGWPSGFAGGKLLEDKENHDRYLTFSFGRYDEKALVSYDCGGNALKRVSGGENCLNVYDNYSASTADILNPEVMDKFIALTHEEYRKSDDYGLKGFFTDEPQYYRWGTAYTKVLPKYFYDTYGEDVLDGLGLLFVEKEGYRAFRYKYWKAMQSLMLENFAKKIYTWCDERGYKLTGHYVEETSLAYQMMCCAGNMPFYEYEHIPGIDYLGRGINDALAQKQVSSVAAQLGKKQVLSETFACCGWDITPAELKKIAELQYVGGVNLMCQHLLPFTEHGQRKRDYPAHYSAVNPWVRENFKEFNDYFSALGELLSESTEIVNVGVLHPIRSAYFGFKRYEDDNYNGTGEIHIPFTELIKELTENQIQYHFIDETLLFKYGSVKDGKLTLGKCSYEYLIIPKIYTMDKSTEKLLREYVKAGGKILLYSGKPEYLEGEKYDYDYLLNNTTMEEIAAAQDFACENSDSIRTAYRKDKQGRPFIYAVNGGKETTVKFTLKNGSSFRRYDIFKDEYETVGLSVGFDEDESHILYISDDKPMEKSKLKEISLGENYTVCGEPDNYLTLDFLRFSTDGVNYSEPFHHMGVFDEMLKRHYKGELFLKYEFMVEELPSRCLLLAEDTNVLSVSVNGKVIKSCGCSEYEKALLYYDVAEFVAKGKNEIIVRINYYQGENVYYALFGENVTEGLKNCLAYDTDIEAVYLKGNFGVYGDFVKEKNENVVLGENFRIGKMRSEVSELITQGFPFFSGNIILKQNITVSDTAAQLKINKRFHLIKVKVNGIDAGKIMLCKRLDLSHVLKKGENEIEITLTVGNRNLLGPFHTKEEEPLFVGPSSYERLGTWTNGKSTDFEDRYAFIKTLE